MSMYRVWDLETSVKTEFKRKANPFSPDNYIVCSGSCHAKLANPYSSSAPARTFGEYFPARAKGATGEDARERRIAACKSLPDDWFVKLLKDTKILVGHNIKFDLLYALGNPNSNCEANLKAWMEWVCEGGIIWDTQLAEYLLAGMEQSSHMLALDDVAPKYGGNVKLDEVKAMWNAGVDTIDIPEDLLMRYLLGYDTDNGFEFGDIGNTEMVFRGQYEAAKKSGQLRSILMNMGSLIFTTEAERNGMFVNQPLGLELADKVAKNLALALAELSQFIPADIPFEFNWNSRFHKSALIFGGKVKYQGPVPVLDDDGGFTYYQTKETHYILQTFDTKLEEYVEEVEGEEPVTRTREVKEYHTISVAEYEKNVDGYGADAPALMRFSGGKNKGLPKTKQVTVPDKARGPKTRIEDQFYSFDGFTKPKDEWAASEPGVYSTSSDVIEALGNRDIPFLKTLASVAAMTKDLGTYFITDDPKTGGKKGMLTMVQLDSIVHHMLNHTSTVTGRLSSSNPNLQNLSKGQKSDVKLMFESRFGEDGVIVQSDFSSLEVYIQAILTRAVKLIDDLKSGKDMHCVRLAAKEKMDYEEVFKLCKVDNDPVWDYKRTGAKVFSFQRAYGAGNATIADATGMALEDVEALAAAEDARYPEIPTYFEQLGERIKKGRIATGNVVPHPDMPGLNIQLGKSYSKTPDGKMYCYKESPAPKFMLKKGVHRSFKPTEFKNYEVQGTGGEFAKAAMYLSVLAFYHYKNFDGLALLVNQVHDAEYGDFHKSVAVKAAALLHVCMEEASTYVEWWFKWKLPLGVPSDTVMGKNMGEEQKITDPLFKKAWRAAVSEAAAVAEPMQRELMQELVPGRVCHIDGDYLAYFAAGNNDLPVGTARHIAKERIEAFRDMSGSTKAHVHLTAKGSTKGERFLIATVKPYQGQRQGHHPRNWGALREYLESAEYVPFTRKMWHDREADDGMAYASAVPLDPVSSVVVATRDKDMRMFPGCHIDWLDYTLTEVPKGAYEVIGKSGLVFGHKWFWLQMLQGDTADNIPGLESYEGKAIGETRAAEHLAGTTCNEEAFEVVSRMYESTYGWEAGYDRLVEQAALLWMRRGTHAPIHDLLHVVPSSPDIRGALGRLINRVKEQRAQIDEYNHRAVQAADDEGTGE